MLPETKAFVMIPPGTVAAASTTEGGVDTIGYDFAEITVVNGNTATNATAVTFIQLSESDTQFCTNYTDGAPIVAFVGAAVVSATAGFVLPTPSTCTVVPVGSTFRFNVDLRGRKRYLGLLVTPAQTWSLSAVAMLSRAHVDPAMNVVTPATNSVEACQCRLKIGG